jgi:SCY1-like protein 1
LSSMKEDDAVMFSHGSLVPDVGRYTPPEVAKSGWDSVRRNPMHAVDAYDYGILVSEVFSGGFSGTDQIGSTQNIPLLMHTSYKRLLHAAPKIRLSVAHFLEQGSRSGGWFDTPLIQLAEGIENLGLKNESEKDEFLRYVARQKSFLRCSDLLSVVSWRLSPKQTTSRKNSSKSRCCRSC